MKSLLLTFFVLFSLFLSSENLIAQKFRIKDYVNIAWRCVRDDVAIRATVYDYSLGPNKYQFLQRCIIEFSDNAEDYTKLMEINTPKQNKSVIAKVNFLEKLHDSVIEFDVPVILQTGDNYWTTDLSSKLMATVPLLENKAVVALVWRLSNKNRKIRYVRISGEWMVVGRKRAISFVNVVYDLNKPKQSALKSITPSINAKISNKDLVRVFCDSEAIVIKGAEPGANIKVYNISGAEIKSVISNNNDVVKIKLPAKQIYSVHIGNSRHKVAMCVP